MRILSRGLWVVAALLLLLTSCAHVDLPDTRVVFTRTSVNGKRVRMELDTGSPSLVLYNTGARRLGLKFDSFTEPAKVEMGDQSFTAPLPIFKMPWYYRLPGIAADADGLFGWPEIRDNILVFDAERRTIRRVEKLPPETANWLKLKVLPDRWLLLETPLGDGSTGAILVDTGAPPGVQMPPDQWKAWKAAHPHAGLSGYKGDTASFGSFHFQLAWTDEIKLGALTLTDIAVENTPKGEADFLHQEVPDAKYVWAIGMYALMRMDLIVDGINGVAYLHPKPPPGPPYPGVKRPGYPFTAFDEADQLGDWTLAQNVRLSSDNVFVAAGDDKWSKKNFDGALIAYARAIELNPNNAEALSDLADIKGLRGDQAGAIAAYTRALELNPENGDAFSGRAASREIEGDFSGSLIDYDKAIALKPDNSFYEQLLRQTLLVRQGRAMKDFAKIVETWKTGWTKSIGLFISGKMDEAALLKAAKKKDLEPAYGQKCEAYYYIGMMRLAQGNTAGARESFQKCREMSFKEYTEYQLAVAELGRMTQTAQK